MTHPRVTWTGRFKQRNKSYGRRREKSTSRAGDESMRREEKSDSRSYFVSRVPFVGMQMWDRMTSPGRKMKKVEAEGQNDPNRKWVTVSAVRVDESRVEMMMTQWEWNCMSNWWAMNKSEDWQVNDKHFKASRMYFLPEDERGNVLACSRTEHNTKRSVMTQK